MKLNANTIEAFLKNLSNTIKTFLIYGPEEGLIQITSNRLVAHFSSDNEVIVIKYDFKDIKDSPQLLREELSTSSLFGEKKLILIENCTASVSKEFGLFIQNNISDTKLIFISGELGPSSTLRKLFETAASCAAIACYKDDPIQMQRFISQYLSARNFKFDNDVPVVLSEILPSNRLLVSNELEKLITYNFYEKQIEFDDVIHVIHESSEVGLDELCVGFINKDQVLIQKNISRMLSENTNFMLIIRVLQKYVSRIIEVISHQEQGLSIDQAIAKLAPPVFFKQKDNLVKCARSINQAKAFQLMDSLLKLEIQSKSIGFAPETLVHNFLTSEMQ